MKGTPLETSQPRAAYRTQPVHVFPWLNIQQGHTTLAQQLLDLLATMTQPTTIVIDGFVGIQWNLFIEQLRTEFEHHNASIQWLMTDTCFLPADQIKTIVAPSLTNDLVFGRLFRGHLEDLWNQEQIALLRQQL